MAARSLGTVRWRWQGWPSAEEARATESVLQLLRCVGLVWLLLQMVVQFGSDSPAERFVGSVAVAVLAVGVVVLGRVATRTQTPRQAIRLTVGALAFDAVVLLGAVTALAATGQPPPWESLLLLVAEGGIRLQLAGAAGGWVLVMTGLVVGDVLAGTGLLTVEALVYRGGLAAIMGLLFGLLSAGQRGARNDAAAHLAALERVDQWRTRLLAVLAHDLRSPLSTTISLARTMLEHDARLGAAERGQLAQRIVGQGERGQRLVADLLTMARLEHGEFPIDARDVELEPVVVAAVTATGVDASVEVPAGLHASIDPERFEQALGNLLDNARRHGAPPVVVSARQAPDGSVELAVHDHGPGVAPDDRPAMFEAFGHGRHAESVGLGLWIVQQIVTAHRGELRYRDGQPAGARFEIHLPPPTEPTR